MLCVLCGKDGVGTRHYFARHDFKFVDHFMVVSATPMSGPPTYACRPCRPDRAVFLNPGDAALHYHPTHEQLVDALPGEREVPESEPAALPVLTWALFDQWAVRHVAVQEERDEFRAEVERLQRRIEGMTRTVEEQKAKLDKLTVGAVSKEFYSVYEDITSR